MKILLVMDPGILVPPEGYGGIERIVALLAEEYHRQGNEVDILATRGSYVEGCATYPIGEKGFPPSKKEMNKAIITAWKFIRKNRNNYDLIHNFGRLLYLFPVLNHPVKKIMCYQREITANNIRIYNLLPNKNIIFSGCSADLVKRAAAPGRWVAIHNAVDFTKYCLRTSLASDAPLIFLGRIERIKGCHTAIKVAKDTNNRLIIAGNKSSLPEEVSYFEKEIAPYIDNQQIIYVGEVNNEQKNEWLGKSKALLMPIEWNEPFGIVMIEAMACGTPVIAFNKGSVNEVIEENVTGFKVASEEEMICAVSKINRIDRAGCRNFSCLKFNIPVIAGDYLNLFNSSKGK
ncbi:MAG: glycosyltransferase [Bacteroidota bacterium]